MCRSTLFLTSALEGGEGSESRPGRTLPPRKTPYPFYRRLGGPQGRSRQVRKISPLPGFDPRTDQPVGSRYTDFATRPTWNATNMLNPKWSRVTSPTTIVPPQFPARFALEIKTRVSEVTLIAWAVVRLKNYSYCIWPHLTFHTFCSHSLPYEFHDK